MVGLPLQLVGLTVFVLAFGWGWRRMAWRWRQLAAVYGPGLAGIGEPLEQRRMQNLILLSGWAGWESHQGITTIAVHETGLKFSLLFPFSLDRGAFFIPFEDLTVTRQDWYLDGESLELEPRHRSDVKIILGQSQMDWIEAAAGERWNAGYSLLHRVPRIHQGGSGEPT